MRLALLVAFSVATACVPTNTHPEIGGLPNDRGRSVPAGVTAPRSEVASKKVSGKEDPNVLIAADRTRCTVSADKYREVALGESVLCAWAK
jgi:hypothetical protein